jgi:tetratricopeptide (TPR) repeat protein
MASAEPELPAIAVGRYSPALDNPNGLITLKLVAIHLMVLRPNFSLPAFYAGSITETQLLRERQMNANTTINDNVFQALNAFSRAEYQTSIRLFNQVLAEDPDHRLSLLSRGSAFLRSNRLDEAVADFDRVISLYPENARAYHLRGLAKASRGDELEALQDFDKAIEIDAVYGAAYASRAAVHERLGHDDLASEDVAMMASLARVNLETYAVENNVWQSEHLRVEDAMETELNR